ncbi:MAG TPA: helix-turn-helix domain-containing protein [Solirubrobacterales bacterium]|nr:helix-turn-helix domain-containing protein [Solirubrobacterales bacterium]
MVEFVSERGYEDVTVRGLARLAGISTGTFYRHFPNSQHCFFHTYEFLMRSTLRRAQAAQSRHRDWEGGVRAGLRSVLEDLSLHPKAAHVVLVEAYAVGPVMHPRIRKEVAAFECLLASGPPRRTGPLADTVRRGIAEGVMRVARTRLLLGQLTRLPADAGALGDWIASISRAPSIGPEDRHPFPSLNGGSESRRQPEEGLRRAIGGAPGSELGRILAAVVKLSAVDGFARLTIPRIRAEAGVPRRYLDDRFAGEEACFLAAIEAIAREAAVRAADEAGTTTDWANSVEAAIRGLCGEVAGNPALARLLFVEILAPGRRGLLCREDLISLAASRLRAAPPEHRPSQLVAEASSAAAWGIVQTDVATQRAGATPRLAPLLAHVSLAPIRGDRHAEVERHLVPNLDSRWCDGAGFS